MDKKISDLQQLRIHELRDLARKMGVSAPTAKKKEKIIEEIYKIMNGETVPDTNPIKKGRPARESAENFNFAEFLYPDIDDFHRMSETTPYSVDDEKLIFSVNATAADYNLEIDSDAIHDREGLIEIKENYGIIYAEGLKNSNQDVYVSLNIINQMELKSGEYVKCQCKTLKPGHPDVAIKVERLCDKPKFDFDALPYSVSSTSIKTNVQELKEFKLGLRYFICPNNHYAKTYEMAKNLVKLKNIQLETLYLNAMEERITYDSELHFDTISFVRSDSEVVALTELYMEKIKRIAESGKDVVLLISEISQYLKACNNLDRSDMDFSTISSKAVLKMKRLISSAKNTSKGSITIIAIDQLRTPLNIKNTFEYEVLPLFN